MKFLLLPALILLSLYPGAWAAEPLKPRQEIEKPDKTSTPAGTSDPFRITVKFRDDLPMRIREGKLSGEGFADGRLAALTTRLEQAGAVWERTHSVPESTLRRLRETAQRNTGKAMPDLNTSFIIRLGKGQDAAALINELNALDFVELAEPVPLPAPPPVAPDYTGDQGYLRPATSGINAEYAWTVPGGTGTGVRIADIEFGYNATHADLPPVTLLGPAPVVPDNPPLLPAQANIDHGTAVLGVLGSRNNGEGTTGIAHGSSLFFAAARTAAGPNIAGAITLAAAALSPGDIILIEQQIDGPVLEPMGTPITVADWMPVEWNKTIYDAIKIVAGNGIIVVEAAGNGSVDLDAATLDIAHKPFRAENDSGAIMVGAGAAVNNARSRLAFSNYGGTVDLQGWGEDVVTTGYGTHYNAEGMNRWYTRTFNGTSSASPIVAGAAACLQGAYRAARGGAVLSPAQIKSLLMTHGTPQVDGTNPANQNIGPLPDLAATLQVLSDLPPVSGQGTVLQQFKGITRTSPGATTAVPPDTHGAVGPQGVLAVVNSHMAYYSKSPAAALDPDDRVEPRRRLPLWNINLAGMTSFFGAGGRGYTGTGVADPKAVYDPASQRFFVIQQENPNDQSFLNIAVSRTNNPTAGNPANWIFYRYEITLRNDPIVGAEVELGGDYPGLAVYPTALLVSYNLFALDEIAGLNGAKGAGILLLSLDKSSLIAGSQPPALRKWSDVEGFLEFQPQFTAMAVQPVGSGQPEDRAYFLSTRAKGWPASGWELRLHSMDRLLGDFRHDHDDVEIDTIGSSKPSAPHPGTGKRLDTLCNRMVSAVMVNGRIWGVWTQKQEDASHTVVRWARLRPEGGQTVLEADGSLDSGSEGFYSYMPAIGANRQGDVCIVFTRSSTTQNPSICSVIAEAGGNFGPVRTLFTSTAAPDFTGRATDTFARWGDYAVVCADPVDDTFWVASEMVNSPSTDDWGTIWTQLSARPIRITQQPPAVPGFSPAMDLDDSLVTLTGNYGANVSMTIQAQGGTSPLIFEWFKNGVRQFPGGRFQQINLPPVLPNSPATLNEWRIIGLRYGDEGDYTVRVYQQNAPGSPLASRVVRLQTHPYPEWSAVYRQDLIASLPDTPFIYTGGAMAYDEQRKVTVLFGGDAALRFNANSLSRNYTNQTWEYDGREWRKATPAVSPPARYFHTMTWDPVRRKILMFGGRNPSPVDTFYNDLWEYDGFTWRNLTPSPLPVPPVLWPTTRHQHSACYDSIRGKLLIIGGSGPSVPLVGGDREDFWLYDSASGTWTTQPKATPWLLGGARHGFVFDAARGVAVLFGPHGLPSVSTPTLVLEWNGSSWQPRYPGTAITPSVARADGDAVYDPWKKEVLLFSNNGFTNDVGAYYWNGRRFQRAVPFTATQFYGSYFGGETVPYGLFSSGNGMLARDTARHAFVHHAALYATPNKSVTAELRFVDQAEFFRPLPPVFFNGSPASVQFSPLTSAANRYGISAPPGVLTFRWFFNEVLLTDGGRISGATTLALTLANPAAADYGTYRLEVTDASGHVISSDAMLSPVIGGPGLTPVGSTPGRSMTLAWNPAGQSLETSSDLQTWQPVPGAVSPFVIYFDENPAAYFRLRTNP